MSRPVQFLQSVPQLYAEAVCGHPFRFRALRKAAGELPGPLPLGVGFSFLILFGCFKPVVHRLPWKQGPRELGGRRRSEPISFCFCGRSLLWFGDAEVGRNGFSGQQETPSWSLADASG